VEESVTQERMPDLRTFSPLTLAYLGDAVYEVFIRTALLAKGNRPVEKLHREAIRYVKASEQAAQIDYLEESLTEEEKEIYRRGCNAKPHTIPKHADPADYRHATGYEALLGWLSLKGETKRAEELMRKGLEAAHGILS
jgi:ribonuclease-3 family protein